MTEIFEKNIKSLVKKDPILASKLFSIIGNKRYEIVQQGDDKANINLIDTKTNLPLYETKPLEEISKTFEEFEKHYVKYPYLFQFGVGNGVFLKLLMQNANHKRIYVYEPSLEILWIVFNLIDFTKEIEEDKIIFFDANEYQYVNAYDIFSDLDVRLFCRTYFLYGESKYYEKVFAEEMKEINQINIRAIKENVTGVGNDTIDTLIGIEHHIQNLPRMLKGAKFTSLANQKLSDVAVIVSTGPSLTKQLPLLKEIQDYVTIISVDASMPILEKWGIVPDFVTSLERVKETAEFFKKTSPEFQKKFTTLHASLQHKEVLDNSYGENILVMRPFRYTRYYNLKDYGYLGRGMSAANMAYELAFLMQYKKIVLIGQDLAFGENGKSHASGHVYGEDEVKSEEEFFVTAYGGKGVVKTAKYWNLFRGFFEQDIAVTRQYGVETINATEGGARIEGAVEKPFSEVAKEIKKTEKKKLKLKYPTQKQIDKNLIKAYKKTLEMIKYGEKVQEKVEKLFLEVAEVFDELVELKDKNELEKINFKKLEKISKKIDKIKEIIESKKFGYIFGETVNSYLLQKEMILALIAVQNPKNEIERKAKLIDWIMNHRDWLFNLAGSINAQVIVVKRAIKNLEEEIKKRGLGHGI